MQFENTSTTNKYLGLSTHPTRHAAFLWPLRVSTTDAKTRRPNLRDVAFSSLNVVTDDRGLTGLHRIETVDPEDPTEGDWGMPPGGGGGRSTVMMSWIDASRASTRVDIWFTEVGSGGIGRSMSVEDREGDVARTSLEDLRGNIVEFGFELFK
jgi:hypothetical protein